MLVPKPLYDSTTEAELLAAAGLAPLSSECVVSARTESGITALMAIDKAQLADLKAKYGEELSFTTPLLTAPNVTEPTVWLVECGDLIYIKVYSLALQLAEVVRIASEEELELLLHRLTSAEDLSRHTLRVTQRTQNKQRRKIYRNYFKQVVCE